MTLAILAYAFGFGLLLGALVQVLLRLKRPDMPPAQRRLKAALPAPVVLLGVCIVGVIGVFANGWQTNDDLALATLAALAVTGGGASFAGGLISAALMEKRAAR